MLFNLLNNVFKSDSLNKVNIIKTISWQFPVVIVIAALVQLITFNWSISLIIGLAVLLFNLFFYNIKKLIWKGIRLGTSSKDTQRKFLKDKNQVYLFKQASKISRKDREMLNNNKSFTLWFTGLSGSGKSTLASEIEASLHQQRKSTYILDGDNIRLGINSDLSFSVEDRAENIRRVAEICKILNDAGIIVIASFISPFEQDRQIARQLISKESFVEVFIDASLEVCQKLDPKGLYKLALSGKIKSFTGIDSPYEKPKLPNIHLETGNLSITECTLIIEKFLIKSEYLKEGYSNKVD